MPANSLVGRPGSAVVPGTATPVFMYPEQRLAVQLERRVRAHTKHSGVEAELRDTVARKKVADEERLKSLQRQRRRRAEIDAVGHGTRAWNAMIRRERSGAEKEEEHLVVEETRAERDARAMQKVASLERQRCRSLAKNRQVHEARQAQCGDTMKNSEQLVKSKSAAAIERYQAGLVRAEESKVIRRLQAMKQGKVRELKTALAWAHTEDVDEVEEEKRRELEKTRVARTEQLYVKDAAKEVRRRKVLHREKQTRTQMHEFQRLLGKAAISHDFSEVHGNLSNYMKRYNSEPTLRPASSPAS